MSLKRPVAGVQANGQLSLLNKPAAPDEPSKPAKPFTQAVRFKDPDPERIWFGDQSLRAYLASAGLGFAFVLRDLFRSVDWSSFEKDYRPGGRSPYNPALMVSVIIYGLIQGATSLRALEDLCRRDLVCHWLTGGACPDHATFGRFISKHADEIAGPLFERLTAAVLEQMPEINRELAGDGTMVEAAASRYVQIKKEAVEQWVEQARQELSDRPDDPERLQQVALAERCAKYVAKRVEARKEARSGKAEDVRVNPSDPEAVYHKLKNGRFAFAYVPSITVNRQRIIVAQTVDQSAEISVVEGMLDQAERIVGAPDRMCLDAGYFGFEVLELADQRELDLLCPAPEQAPNAKKPKKFAKHQFDYLDELRTYVCPAGEQMIAGGQGFNRRENQQYQYFRTPACNQGCELRDKCTRSKRGRRIKRWELDELQETMRRVMNQPRAIAAYSHRQGSVEPVFAELKYIQGLDRFRRRGIQGVQVEFSLHAIAHNLRRLKVALRRLLSVFWTRYRRLCYAMYAHFLLFIQLRANRQITAA